MKISINQYANILYDLTENKPQKEIDEAISGLTKFLVKNRQIKNLGKIIKRFQEIYNEKQGIIEVEVTSQEKLDKEILSQLKKSIKAKYKAKEVVLNNKIDKNILGGIVVRVGDEVVDGSGVKKVSDLRQRL